MKIKLLLVLLFTVNAFSQSGNLDPSFGNSGKVHTGFGTGNNSMANAVAVQPDGKIIVGGSAYTANTVNSWETDTNNAALIRYDTNGIIDTTFGNDGVVMNDFYTLYRASNWNSGVLCIKLQSDGKILTYGFASQNYTSLTILSQYNSDGSPDSSFGNNGRVVCNSSPVNGNNTLVIQPDGKILVLGVQPLNPSANVYSSEFVVERYNTDGSIDNNFATNGRVSTAFGSSYDIPKALALQTDGKIIAVGVTTGATSPRFAIARYTANGDLDTTFDDDGKVLTSFGTGMNSSADFVTLYPDGKIMVVGTTTGIASTDFALAKYNTNGSLDTSFDGDGKATNAFDTNDSSYGINSVLEQPDGKFVITTTAYVGGTYDQADDFVTRRYNSDGTTDTSFGVNGKATTTFQTGFNTGLTIAIQADSKILAAGYSHPLSSSQNDFNVLRYHANGALDTTFDNDGKVETTLDSSNDDSTVLLLQPDNKLISIGIKRNLTGYPGVQDIAISRYNTDGSPDTSFGNEGKVVSIFGHNINNINQAVLQLDGKIVVSNTYTNPFVDNLRHFELVRYTVAGSIDLTFGTEGKVTLDAETNSILSQPDGKIITAYLSYDSQNNAAITLKRFNNDGTLDTGFDNDGTASVTGTFYGYAKAAIQPDGKIVIATSSRDINNAVGLSIIRFNTNGSLDSTENDVAAIADNTCYAHAIFFQPDGKIIVAGRSSGVSGGYDFFQFVTARFNSDGSIDTTYGTNGMIETYLGSYFEPYAIIQSVVLQPDGKFLVALSKPEHNLASPNPNSYDFIIYRFNANGDYDSDFGIEGKITTSFYNKYDEAFSMTLQPDGKFVIGGTTDTGINRDFALVRYENVVALNVNDLNLNANLMLSPNPAKDIINIKFQEHNDETITNVTICNMLGQSVFKENENSAKINISHLQTGIYILKATTNKGNWSKKFIKD